MSAGCGTTLGANPKYMVHSLSGSASTMQPALRGSVEKFIDIALDEESLTRKYQMFSYYHEEGIIGSVESALFGSVWTSVVTALVDVKTRARQEMSESEMEEFRRIFDSRALEIKSRITEIANL